MLIKDVLIFRKPAGTVAHGVSIFADDARLRMWIFAKLIHQRHTGVHGGDDIHHFGVTIFFVMDQTRVIQRFRGVIHGADVTAVSGFVAERPDDDRRVVFLCMDVAHDALNVDVFPQRIVGYPADIADIGEAVRFNVGFGHHEQTVDIAQFIEARIVRVMGGTHGIDVVLLH